MYTYSAVEAAGDIAVHSLVVDTHVAELEVQHRNSVGVHHIVAAVGYKDKP